MSADHSLIMIEILAALENYDSALTLLGGCTDGNCVIKKPIGMHTNGGCRCYTDETKARRAMQCASFLRARLQTAIKAKS